MLLLFVVVCKKRFTQVVLNTDVVVGINYESVFSESNFVTIVGNGRLSDRNRIAADSCVSNRIDIGRNK